MVLLYFPARRLPSLARSLRPERFYGTTIYSFHAPARARLVRGIGNQEAPCEWLVSFFPFS